MDHCVECHVCHLFYDVTKNSMKKNTCNRCYRKENYHKYKERVKRYTQSTEGKKYRKIAQWRCNGLICDTEFNEYGLLIEYEKVYQLWLDSTHCDKCGCQYTKKNRKCMDHCHTTGKFRGIVCNRCNINMLDLKKYSSNKSGHKNIFNRKGEDKYVYQKRYYGKRIRYKTFKTLTDALCFKYIMLLRLKAGHYN